MHVSAELRWFWPTACPDAVRDWYHAGPFPPGGGEVEPPRVDRYFLQGVASEVGVKLRAAKGPSPEVEFKGLIAVKPSAEPLAGQPPMQIWCKWTVVAPGGGSALDVAKARWMRKFKVEGGVASELALDHDEKVLHGALPDVGCNVELTRVALQAPQRIWWTLGFEAFGDLASAPAALQLTLKAMRPLPPLDGAFLSYPGWLATLPNS